MSEPRTTRPIAAIKAAVVERSKLTERAETAEGALLFERKRREDLEKALNEARFKRDDYIDRLRNRVEYLEMCLEAANGIPNDLSRRMDALEASHRVILKMVCDAPSLGVVSLDAVDKQ